jgi:hypothetical protein
MKRLTGVAWLLAVISATTANAQAPIARNPTPERVTTFIEAGGVIPVGRFADAAHAGFAPSFGGYYRVNDFIAPAFQLQWAFLEPDRDRTGGVGSLDMVDALVGVRFYVPLDFRVRPWATLLTGIAHYESYHVFPLEPVIGTGRTKRTDPVLSIGGGFDVDLHPNFSLGFDWHTIFSFSTDKSRGENTLTAMSLGAAALFHF